MSKSNVGGSLPDKIETVDELEAVMSAPAPAVTEVLGELDGDLIILGAGGKMGPSLARQARRAMDEAGSKHRVIAVSRFGQGGCREALQAHGIETLACDLLDPVAVASLPDAAAMVFMAGMKFGASAAASLTWAMNTYVPALVGKRYAGVPTVVFSSGNVYPFMSVDGPGASESTPPEPVGEYAQSVLGRERIFEYFATALGTPVLLFRLFYATELRYGILHDVASKVLAGEPVALTMGHANCIWQGDANGMALRSLALASSPARCLNVTGPERCVVRDVALQFGARYGRSVAFEGKESDTALVGDVTEAMRAFGPSTVSLDALIHWVAHWVQQGGASLGKPTHFEVRDGQF